MARGDALRLICESKLARLTKEGRAEQLDIMMVEDWDSDPLWSSVSPEVRREFEEQIDVQDACLVRYEPVLMIWLRSEIAGARNDYLLDLVRAIRPEIEQVAGEPSQLLACPCCGYRTLSSHGDYDICKVCWWEDDGQRRRYHCKACGKTFSASTATIYQGLHCSRDEFLALWMSSARYATSSAPGDVGKRRWALG